MNNAHKSPNVIFDTAGASIPGLGPDLSCSNPSGENF